MHMKTWFSGIFLVVLLSFFAVRSLFAPNFFPMHDDTQVARVYEMYKALADGMFPVRWVSDLGYGYGYPIFNFYAPLAYYVGAFFMFLGFNALVATKIMIGTGLVLAGVFMYFLARVFWGKIGGIISGLLYLYAPYHALNVYVRGAVAETWAYALLPLAFLGVFQVYKGSEEYANLQPRSKIKDQRSKISRNIWYWICLTSLSFAAIILSHNLTAMMVTPFIFAFALFLYVKLRLSELIYKPYFVLLGLLIGMLLSAFYSLPVIFEMKFTDVLSVVGGGSDYNDHFACLSQLWNSPWGFAGSAPGCNDGFSLKIGKLHIILAALSFISLVRLRSIDKSKFQTSILFMLFLLVSAFLTIKESKFIWDMIPHMAFFQFPWRFLVLICFFISFLGGCVFRILKTTSAKNMYYKFVYWGAGTVMIAAIILVNSKLFVPQEFNQRTSDDYTSENELKWRVSKISDEYMPKNFLKPIIPFSFPQGKITKNEKIIVSNISEKTQKISFTTNASQSAELNLNIAYFPGWHVYVDDNQEWFGYSNKGLVLKIPQGEHKIDIKFIQTPVEKIGNALTVAGVMVLVIGIIKLRKNESKQKKAT